MQSLHVKEYRVSYAATMGRLSMAVSSQVSLRILDSSTGALLLCGLAQTVRWNASLKTLGKAIRAAFIDQRNWKQELYTFLRQYRATPHSSTGVSPSELLNGRQMKIMLPELRQETQPTGTIDNRDALEKSKDEEKRRWSTRREG